MANQPDISKCFDKHVGRSSKPRVSGVYDIWICGLDGKWTHHNDLPAEGKQALQKICAEHGEQVHSTQWDFTDADFIQYVQPILEGSYANAVEEVAW